LSRNESQSTPQHLRKETRKFFERIVADYEMSPHHLELLRLACEALDRATEARLAVEKAGAFFKNRHGEVKPHPGLAVERDNRALFGRLLRELNLDSEAPAEAYSRPSRIPGRYR
jgi:phage terminase small subunit